MRVNLIHPHIMMNNKWREIPSYSGYIINDKGEVIRKAATVLKNEKIKHVKQRKLKLNRSDKGYVTVNLSNGDSTKKMYVHRLVYSAFHPEEDISHMEIDHKDTDRQNNELTNLRAVSSKENKSNPRTIEKYKRSNALDKGKFEALRAWRKRYLASIRQDVFKRLDEACRCLKSSGNNVTVSSLMKAAKCGYKYAKEYLDNCHEDTDSCIK